MFECVCIFVFIAVCESESVCIFVFARIRIFVDVRADDKCVISQAEDAVYFCFCVYVAINQR